TPGHAGLLPLDRHLEVPGRVDQDVAAGQVRHARVQPQHAGPPLAVEHQAGQIVQGVLVDLVWPGSLTDDLDAVARLSGRDHDQPHRPRRLAVTVQDVASPVQVALLLGLDADDAGDLTVLVFGGRSLQDFLQLHYRASMNCLIQVRL